MNRFIFIPGKNPELSLAELASWFDSNGIYFRVQEAGKGFIIAEAKRAPDANSLGGMIKVCSLMESFQKKAGPAARIFDRVPVRDFPRSRVFGLSVYPDSGENSMLFRRLALSLKRNLRQEGIAAKFMPVPKDRSALTHVEVIKKELEEIVVCLGEEKTHVGKTVSVHNPFEFKKRDVDRPSQRPMFSIPPRLARIMVNLSQARMEGRKLLLDPFCGMGTILQEASLMGFDILGTDIDEECCLAAIENLYWLSQDYSLGLQDLDKKIMRMDATKLSKAFGPKSIDAIVTEPNLGPALKIAPGQNKAEGILRGLKPLYQKSLQEFSFVLKPGGRVCMVLPRFEFGEHFAHPEALKLAARAGLKPVDILKKHNIQGSFPYVDKEQRHKTIREIWVFEKMPEPASRPEDLLELRYTKKNFTPG
jgi:tRNA G10  N-methylase Trm11